MKISRPIRWLSASFLVLASLALLRAQPAPPPAIVFPDLSDRDVTA